MTLRPALSQGLGHAPIRSGRNFIATSSGQAQSTLCGWGHHSREDAFDTRCIAAGVPADCFPLGPVRHRSSPEGLQAVRLRRRRSAIALLGGGLSGCGARHEHRGVGRRRLGSLPFAGSRHPPDSPMSSVEIAREVGHRCPRRGNESRPCSGASATASRMSCSLVAHVRSIPMDGTQQAGVTTELALTPSGDPIPLGCTTGPSLGPR